MDINYIFTNTITIFVMVSILLVFIEMAAFTFDTDHTIYRVLAITVINTIISGLSLAITLMYYLFVVGVV